MNSYRAVKTGKCAEGIAPTGGQVRARIGIVKRRIHSALQCIHRIENAIGNGIKMSALPSTTLEGASWNLVVANAIGVRRNPRGATKGHGLAAFIPLDAADGPSANHAIQNLSLIQKLLVLAERQFVNIAEHKVLGQILIADCLVAILIEGILRSTALVQSSKERQSGIGICQSLRPGIGSH